MSDAEPQLPAAASGPDSIAQRLAGRRVLVVGGGRRSAGVKDEPPGNGQAVCVLSAVEGAAAVGVVDRDDAAAEETVGLLKGYDAAAVKIVADVSDPGDCLRTVDTAEAAMGGIDAVVLNVGLAAGGLGLESVEPDTWNKVFDINLRSHVLIAQHALPRMPPGGAFVFVSSVAGLRPGSRIPAYDASKAAIIGLGRHVALEGSRRGVRANVVAPGLIDTPLGRLAAEGRPNRNRTPVPLGRQGTAWEVARAIVFLLSDEASYITGHTLAVDGGLSM
jgi:NAD(P)-dependent dehydrogenase (short-subunit alcohol dehydrogenase family)